MAKNKVSEWSATPANNTDIGGINIAEGCAPSGINNAIRELMAQVKDLSTGADGDNLVVGGNLSVTGTATGVTATFGDSTTKFATTAFVQAALAAIYPVGSIYTNATNSTNPGTLLGFGTWAAFGAGRVMVGLDASNAAFDTAEETGGSADSIVVSHSHNISGTANTRSITGSYDTAFRLPSTDASGALSVTAGSNVTSWASSGSGPRKIINLDATHDHSISGTADTTGSSGTNANLQPYITVYMWKRTA